MPRGKKKSHKGGHRHFTSEDDLAVEAEKARKQKEWRAKKGIESDEEEGEEGEGKEEPKAVEPGQLPSDASGEEEDEEEDAEDNKPKGVAHLIEIENPNRAKQKTKKVTSISVDGAASAEPTLSRKEREELEKQQAKERYQKMHIAGKTEEARADLARLALIRKQREDAAKKRDEEKKAAEEAKTAAEQRLLDKKQKAGTGDKN